MTTKPTHRDDVCADLLFKNGAIYTVDRKRPWARAVAVKGAEIIYVGDDQGAADVTGPRTEVIDLDGKMMLPGLHDSHVHLYEGGMQLLKCDLWDCHELDQAISEIKRHVGSQGRDAEGWIQFTGLQKTCADELTKDILDEIAPDRPMYIMTSDGHSCRTNTRALELAGVDKDTEDPPQGRIERMPGSREPSGYLHDFASKIVKDAIPTPSLEEQLAGLENGIEQAHRFGITSIIEPGVDDTLMAPYLDLSDRDALTLRLMASISPIHWQPGAFGDEIFDFVAARDKYRRPGINVESVKMYIDGVLENGTAVLLEPYLMDKFNGNAPFYTQEDLNRYITWIDSQDLQVHLHAIGDGGVRMALDAFEAARMANGKKDNRHHICHVQMTDPEDAHRFGDLGVTANFQPVWAYPDPWVTELNAPAIGEERLEKFYVIGSVHRLGGRIACGSDWFVSSLNPLDAIEVGVRRQDLHLPEGAPSLNPEEAVDLAVMIEGYTINGAYLMHQEDRLGSIEVGKLADLIVLDRNLFEIPPTEISEASVLLTLFNGRPVYNNGICIGDR
jgi:hypothetical protein